MIRIPFDLGRSSLVSLDDQPGGVPVEHHRSGIMDRDTWRELRRLVHIRQDLLRGNARASVESCQCEARAERLEKAAAAQIIEIVRHRADPSAMASSAV